MQKPYGFSGTPVSHTPPAASSRIRTADGEPGCVRRAKGMGSHAFL